GISGRRGRGTPLATRRQARTLDERLRLGSRRRDAGSLLRRMARRFAPRGRWPGGLRLQALRAETPQAQALRAVLKALDVRLAVRRAPTTRLVAVLDTPRGRIELAGP